MLRLGSAVRAAALAVFALAPVAAAQRGYTTEKYKQHGLRFELARSYEWLAIQPNEEWVVLQWVDKSHEGRSALRNATGGHLMVVRVDWTPDPEPEPVVELEPDEGDGGDGDGDGGGEEDEAEPEEEPEPPPPPITTWKRFAEQRLRTYDALLLDEEEHDDRDGYAVREYELRPKKSGRRTKRGWACVFERPEQRTFAVVGFALDKAYEDQRKIWRHTAGKMRFSEPEEDSEIAKWRRFYERRPKFKGPEYRIRVRSALEGDWEAEDTENYIVVYNTPDQPLVRRILRDLEYIREEYVELFPPEGEIDAVSTVRVCADKDEYMAYGGMQRSAGYWNWATEELVFYDSTKREKGEKTDRSDNLIVLYHEAFHQFIHYSVGQLAPHSWFNEGYGDFFSGAQISGGKVKRIGPNPWRLGTIQRTVEKGEHVPWAEILRYERKDYYGQRQGYYYAQGWAMVYFLESSKKVQKHRVWSRILPTYFDELKAAWREERAKLPDGGVLSVDMEPDAWEEVAAAQLKARKRALEVAFEGVDLAELEEAWEEFVLDLEL